MASKTSSTPLVLFLTLNLLFFSLTTTAAAKCPRNTLRIGACVDVLNTLSIRIGRPPVRPCCSLIQGLADAEAAVCLCTAIKASVLGSTIRLPVKLGVFFNVCRRTRSLNRFLCR